MKYSIKAAITPEAAAKLIITNDIDLSESWSYEQSREIIDSILQLKVSEILQIIDEKEFCFLDTNDIPQFGSIESIERVPFILSDTGIRYLSYAQLGYYLKQDVNAKLEANIKFGENHGKGASLVGIARCVDGQISCSSLSIGFCKVTDPNLRKAVIVRLYFRIPIVQQILRHAAIEKYNGYDSMVFFTESTKKRRSQCLRKIFVSLKQLQDQSLDRRLNNIFWSI